MDWRWGLIIIMIMIMEMGEALFEGRVGLCWARLGWAL
jgi:hypothetical protein